MKLAISNLAWSPDEDEQIVKILHALQIKGIELAPTKNWPLLETVVESEARALREKWDSRGFEICALQSILFGRSDLQLFVDQTTRTETILFIKKVIDIAHWLGAKVLVFGSPKNRVKAQLSYKSAFEIAVPFFREIGDYASERGCNFCIEPNPPDYGCDFVVTSQEGAELVKAVDSAGFGLHLDSAGMYLIGEHVAESIGNCAAYIRHVHLSAPNLEAVNESSPIDYSVFFDALDSVGYDGWRSVEMKPNADGQNASSVERALRFLSR